MSISVGRSILGLLVISLSFICPWSKLSPDPVCCSGHDWDMCPAIPPCNDFNSSTKALILEEIDKRTNSLKVGLEARIHTLENFTKVVNMSVIDSKMRELQKDTNTSTESRIKDIVESLKVSLNKSTESRIQGVIYKQNKILENLTKVEEDFQRFREVTNTETAKSEGRYKEFEDKLRELKQDVNKFTENRVNDAVEGLNSKLQQTENQLQELLQNHTKTIENLKKIEDEFEKYKQVTDNTIARIEQRGEDTEDEMKKMKEKVDASLEKGTWGLLVILIEVMVVVLFLYVCFFLNNDPRPRLPEPRPQVQVAPLARVDRGDNNTLCIVYFVERDLRQLRRWTDEIIEEAHAVQRMRTIDYVIASRDDIRNILTCRLALVFVNPDEQQLILEDDFHMGSTRRDTVQALRGRGAEVILIVYGDPTSRIRVLQDGSLFDPSLTQVKSHPVLRDLNSRNRILSVKESFSAYQKRHLVATIDQIFT